MSEPKAGNRWTIPIMAARLLERVAAGEAERGVLICTSGIGMSIAANKFPGVRAALVTDLDGAQIEPRTQRCQYTGA